MALPDRTKYTIGTSIVVADSNDYLDSQGFGSRTDQIDLTSLGAAAARQSDKLDFTLNLDVEYVLGAGIEFATAPTAGETVDFYIGWSAVSSFDNNPGGLIGSDSAYSGYSSNLDDSLKQLQFLGSLTATVQATTAVQIDTAIRTFTPRLRYGTLVVVNNTSAIFHSNAAEMAVSITPLTIELQD